MPRPLIVFKSGSIQSDWMLPLLQRHFDFQIWEENKKYGSRDILWHNYESKDIDWSGPRIFEKLWDQWADQKSHIVNNVMHLSTPNWMRFNESIWWRHMGYDKLLSRPGGDKFFLMQINLIKPHRDAVFQAVQPWLEDSLISYYSRGHRLPNDIDADPFGTANWQRYCNIDWYNRTQFSVVVESMASPRLWISEKIYKPLAFGHGFLVWGSCGTLQFLKTQGFQTFDHVIDESYDTIINSQQRLAAIIKQLGFLYQEFCTGSRLFQDAESLKRIQHNHDLFFDPMVIDRLLLTELIEPIQKFIDEQT